MACMCGDTHCSSCGPAQGNWKCPICQSWHIQNSTGTATLQFLNTLAQSQGHSTALPKPETIEDLAGVLNELLGGVQVVFTRSVDKNPRDPEFATILRTRKILSPDVATSPKQMKYYQNNGYRIAWEQ